MNGSNFLVDTNFLIYLLNGKTVVTPPTLKLPDAIVAASALYMSLPLVTADKSFLKIPGLDLHLLKL
jgi:predicted nucleic acid-binding protein